MKFRMLELPEKGTRYFFCNGWNKGRDKKFCITSDRISGFPVSAVLCDIPQLSRHNRSKREITAESILELDGGFCGVDGKTQWARNRRFESNSKRICFSRNTGHVVQIFMTYQISFFPFNFFLHFGYSYNIRVKDRDHTRTIECKNEIWTNC